MSRCVRKYTLLSLLFDLFMIFITAGIWLLWIAIREARIIAGSRR